MKILYLIFFLLLGMCGAVAAPDMTAAEIVQKSDALMRGKSSKGEYQMEIITPRWKRTLKFKAWSEGTDKSFIVSLYPEKDKGSTFLRIKSDMWQYIPRIEKTIKIPPSMMLQSWMGSDFTNDDLAKESSIANDYKHTMLRVEGNAYVIESVPKPDTAAVWGKIIQWIDKDNLVPLKDEYFDEDGTPVRRLIYEKIKKLPDRFYPMLWTLESLDEGKKGHKTVLNIENIELDAPVDEDIFSISALKKYSR